tara:strand:- start:46 stop:576 length:531 start_codon:yes stop_codon:yes gene_type:complete
MGTIKTTNIEPIATNGTVTLGSSGDTFTLATGVTMTVPSGAMSGQNYPAFKAVMTSNQAISATTETIIQINSEVFDIGGYFNTSTYRFTPPAGKYCFIANVANNTVESYLYGRIYKNGANLAQTLVDATPSVMIPVHVIDEANGTDYYDLRAYAPTNTTIISTTTSTFFSAFRLGS